MAIAEIPTMVANVNTIFEKETRDMHVFLIRVEAVDRETKSVQLKKQYRSPSHAIRFFFRQFVRLVADMRAPNKNAPPNSRAALKILVNNKNRIFITQKIHATYHFFLFAS